jgi:hypoxanthine phosphoribosyltransferase
MAELSKEVLLTAEQLAKRIEELAEEISRDYQGRTLTAVCILKGSFVTLADLIRKLTCPVSCEFIRVSLSDENDTPREVQYTTPFEIAGKDILLIEDILDTGVTLNYLINQLSESGPRSLRVLVLLDKSEARKVEIEADYTGFKIPNRFVVGYGLDFNERYRELPYITWMKS